ncbi:MAG TPA: vWA domain-containing protein, partial [Pirellulales bacterium]|nr:vWA domain-containing protein [Pirellulales bacterium]
MGSEPSEKRSRAQSWQGDTSAPKKSKGSGRAWEGGGLENAQRVARRNFFRRSRAFGMFGLVLVLIGVVIWLLIPREAATPLVAWSVTDYSDPIPVNAWAQEDLEGFDLLWGRVGPGRKSLLPGTSYNLVLENLSRAWNRPDWHESVAAMREQLKRIKPGGPQKNVVIFYISAHGTLNDQAQPCLLPASPSGDDATDPAVYLDTSRWLPLKTLLSEINASLPAHVHKVVLLDAMRLDSDWRLGMLYNGFADRLATAVRESGASNMSVINSASPGQTSWSSARLRRSAFGHFVQRALNGKDADHDGDDKVTLDELHQYLKRNVANWTLSNCYDDQVPMLFSLGEPADIQVAWVRAADTSGVSKPATTAAVPSSQADWEACFELWKVLDRLAPSTDDENAPAPSVDVLAWGTLRQQLLRLEQCLHAGQAYAGEASRLLARATALAKQLQKPDERMAAATFDVNMAEAQGLVTLDDVELTALVEQWRRPDPAAGAAPAGDMQEPFKGDPLVPVAAAWRWAGRQFDPRELPMILKQLDRSQSLRPVEPLEQRFLRLVQSIPDSVRKDPDIVPAAVGLRQRADAVSAAMGDYRIHYFARPMMNRGDDLRRVAEDDMFVGAPANLNDAQKSWAKAGDTYDTAHTRSLRLRRAMMIRDRVWSDLPYLARWLGRRGHHDRPGTPEQFASDLRRCATLFATNRELAGQLEELHGAQYAPAYEGARFDAVLAKIDQLAKQQQAEFSQLRATFDAVVSDTVDNTAHVRNWRENGDLLATPLLSPRLRERLRRQYQAVEMSQSLEADDDASAQAAVAWIPPLKGEAHPALALLPASLFELENLRLEPAREEPTGDDRPDRDRTVDQIAGSCKLLRDRLRAVMPQEHKWLVDQADKASESASPRTPLSAADQLARAAATLVPAATIYDRENAPNALRDYDTQRFLVWQTTRVLDDFWGPDETNAASDPYFSIIARRLLDAATTFGKRTGPEYREEATRLEQLAAAARAPLTVETEKMRTGRKDGDLVEDYRVSAAQGIPLGVAAMSVGDPSQRPVNIGTSSDALGQRAACDLRSGAAKGQLFGRREPDSAGAFADTLSLDVWYRAHRASKPFHIPRGTSDEIVTIKPPYVEPRVTVVGDSLRAGAIAFILDCSGSMAKVDPGAPADRITQAKNELKNVLGQLAPAGTYRVSLWFYGHRVGVDRSHKVVRNDQWPEPIDPGILPSDDIEMVWSGTLSSETKEEAFR